MPCTTREYASAALSEAYSNRHILDQIAERLRILEAICVSLNTRITALEEKR